MTKVFLIGRPNVGKSSLMNAIIGYRRSIVYDQPGTTIDLVSEKVDWAALNFIDTQGVFSEGDTDFLRSVLEQAGVILFVVDAKVGKTPFDSWISREIRKQHKPTLMILNKAESKGCYGEEEFADLDISEMITASASHRTNIDFIRNWCKRFAKDESAGPETLFRFTLIGRPNSGKSTLMNRLCREHVSRVSPEPLTTRDPVSYEIESEGGVIKITDTAGMRRPRSKKSGIEEYSIQATTRMIRESEAVCLLVNAAEALTDQDMRLLNLVVREGKPVLVLLNQWDKLNHEQRKHFFEYNEMTRYLEVFKTLSISAMDGLNCDRILPTIRRLVKQSKKRIPTSKLNRIIETMIQKNPPPQLGRKYFNIMYASQVRVEPPVFLFFMNRKGVLGKSYKLYLQNELRQRLGMQSQAFKVLFREE